MQRAGQENMEGAMTEQRETTRGQEAKQPVSAGPVPELVRRLIGWAVLGFSQYDNAFYSWAWQREREQPHGSICGCCCTYDCQDLWPGLMLCGCQFEANPENGEITIYYHGTVAELIKKMEAVLGDEDE